MRLSLSAIRVGLLGAVCAVPTFAAAADPVLYRFSGATLYDGEFGSVHAAQMAAAEALHRCGTSAVVTANGRMDLQTRRAIRTLAACPEFSTRLDAHSEARQGAITEALWTLLTRQPRPSVVERARTLMLTFEATDYTALEWNFCQSAPLYDPAHGRTVCYSNDPSSFITWGPNGATAGGGREVQAIIRLLDDSDPNAVDQSLGSEAPALRRLVGLRGRPSRDTETYLCGVWAQPQRRADWRKGFERLGARPAVRETYDRAYRSSSLDGGKIATFARAYADHGLTPSEVDFAFFKDRAAHTSVVYGPISAAIATLAGPNVEHWKVRRAISLAVRPGNQRQDRLGRDVAFYVDGLSAARLQAEERTAWTKRGSRRASDVGLSDERATLLARPEPLLPALGLDPPLTAAERAACPAAVLATQRPRARP